MQSCRRQGEYMQDNIKHGGDSAKTYRRRCEYMGGHSITTCGRKHANIGEAVQLNRRLCDYMGNTA